MAISPSTAPEAGHKAFQVRRSEVPEQFTPGDIVARRRHPRFNLLEKHWRFLLESYQGGPDYMFKGYDRVNPEGIRNNKQTVGQRNLFKYFKEGNGEYRERIERSHRNNYSKKVVDQIRAFVARKPAERTADPSIELEKFWRNADGRGRDIDRFMALELQWAAVFGLIWVLVDKPDVATVSRDEELKQGLPFLKTFFPFDVLDGGFDSMGELKWIMFRERTRVDDDPTMAAPIFTDHVIWDREKVERWRIVSMKDEKNQSRPTAMLISTVQHGLGFVPVRPLRFTDSDDAFVAAGMLDDVSYLDRDVYNKMSLLDTIIYDQTFSQLVIPTDAIVLNSPERTEQNAGVDAIETSRQRTRQRITEMGTKRVFLFNGQTSHPPRYISPDASQVQVIRDTIKDYIEEIYRITGLRQEIGRDVRTQSGTSKAYDFDKLNKVLSFIAQEMELQDKWQSAVTEKWLSLSEDSELDLAAVDDLVQYPRNFDITGLLEEIDTTVRSEELNLHSSTAEAEQRRRIIQKMFPGLPNNSDLMKAMMEEIDDWLEMAKKMSVQTPLRPPPEPTPGDEPSGIRGPGGGARLPGAGPPTRPTVQQANAGARGMS